MDRENVVRTEQMFFRHDHSQGRGETHILHCHTQYEVLFLFEGNIDYLVEGAEYLPEPASMLLIPANAFHGVAINDDAVYHRCSLHFSPELLPEPLREVLLKPFLEKKIYYPGAVEGVLEAQLRGMIGCMKLPEGLQATALHSQTVALLCEVAWLYENGRAEAEPRDRLVGSILRYLNGHLRETLQLEDVAKRFYISKNHLNVIFRAATGTTVNQYVRLKRLAAAQADMQRGVPATEAAEAAGFGDYSNFYKAYRAHYGCSPSRRENIRPA